jgi:hypothetical protein
VYNLDDDGLLSEFRALQMLALYNGPAGADTSGLGDDVSGGGGDQSKKGKHAMDEDLEEFLLQQVTALSCNRYQLLSAFGTSPQLHACGCKCTRTRVHACTHDDALLE